MNNWQYAAGYFSHDDLTPHDKPGSYEKARTDLDALIRRFGDEDWMIGPCIIKRCERYPEWQVVNDHAVEVAAEAMSDLAVKFAPISSGIVQGKDLVKVFKNLATHLAKVHPEEYDS